MMKRRRAIYTILAAGAGITATYTGFKFFRIYKKPDFNFLKGNEVLIGALAEVIIPRTNTPGATDTNAAKFIIQFISESAGRIHQNNFIDGLKNLQKYCSDNYQQTFEMLGEQEKILVVKEIRTEGKNYSGNLGKVKNKVLGKSFFHLLKEYTIIAYCTSEAGATEALAYQHIPGEYKSCIPLASAQRSWATK